MKSQKQKLKRRMAHGGGQTLTNRIESWLAIKNETADPSPETLARWSQTYREIRDACWRINNRDLVPIAAKEAVIFAAKELGMLETHKLIVMEHEDESALLADFGIYNYRVGGKNILERYWEEHGDSLNELERKWITGALKSRYTLLLLGDSIPGVGIWARDIFTGDSLFVTDVNFSRTATAGLTLATRITPIDDFYTTNGAPLPVFELSVLVKIGEYLVRSFNEVKDFRNISPERSAWLEAFIIRTIREEQGTNRVRYADP